MNVDKDLRFLQSVEIKKPPFSEAAKREAGYLLRQLQRGDSLGMPHSRPMPSIGNDCHELRVNDENKKWRIIYRIDESCIMVLGVFPKKTPKTPQSVIDVCKQRLKHYDEV